MARHRRRFRCEEIPERHAFTAEERVLIVEGLRECRPAVRLAWLHRLIDGGEIRPVVGAVFPLAKARQAYEHKPARGKVVLEVAA